MQKVVLFAYLCKANIEKPSIRMRHNYILLIMAAALCLLSCKTNSMNTIYQFSALSNKGQEVNFADYKGKVLLIVNTASKCGFTPQYDGLEDLYQKYKERGLVIIGFPCDQFGHQEPGTDEQIEEFGFAGFAPEHPLSKLLDEMFSKADPDYASKPDIKWNFTKFLIDRKGKVVGRFEPTTEPAQLGQPIEEQLK